MDLLRLGEKGIFLSQRRRKWLILMAISGVSGYGVYKVYHLPSVARKRKRLFKILGAFVSVAELISDSAETVSIVTRDLKAFLSSDSDDIPNSLKQIAKITRSNEFTDSVSRVSQALTIGVFRGYSLESASVGDDSGIVKSESSVVDRVIDKVFSKAGSGFVSVVVGSFAKNLILGFYSDELVTGVKCKGSDSSETPPKWVSLLCDDKCRELLADCIQRFTSTAVAVYLDKTMDINTYDQIFEGLTNPKHQDSVKDVLVSVCNNALETLVRTSHEVFTSSKSSNVIEEIDGDDLKSNGSSRSKMVSESGDDGIKSNGWAETISTTLAVPSNRRFMFDVTGRVTLETTRSIMAFIMLKTFQGFRKSINVVNEEVTDRGRQVVGYVGAKSSVIITVCLALYLHVISGCVRNPPIGVSQHF
ncbi:PREDICTED: protein PHLOEM PROTEIN 2-LIKE A10-like isoform X2 [Camelina sativa]|uniref:Protein PHLOEM PROTEIN 2-LIKE A10-like isoform X1 n=1 Tax=Camelina sativa TaxID=90675 RepID=A0ABM0WTD0_CAMSA|nr:PREDICTED: protein PHLOEM PROTEIN 2-LIKE A10-like isoform X1 [Camelina sativa]XP_010475877.1 PREDICTED: protein PHLOEM PROTEIN 2-LIKE A10-like isoform X2 [Camelina sativa]